MATTLEQKIEGLLFAAGRALTLRELTKLTGANKSDVRAALTALAEQYEEQGRALRILSQSKRVQLVTAPDVAPVVKQLFEEEFTGKLSRAALETLAIISYRGPIPKPEIDQLRGVNSAIMLRTLMIRGLVDRRPNPRDARTHLYELTPDFLRHLSVPRTSELPDYADLSSSAAVDQFLEAQRRQEERERAIQEDSATTAGAGKEEETHGISNESKEKEERSK